MLLTSYKINPIDPNSLEEGDLVGVPLFCKRCGNFKRGHCVSPRHARFQQCARGLSVYYDELNARAIIGMAITGRTSVVVRSNDGVISLTERQFLQLQEADAQNRILANSQGRITRFVSHYFNLLVQIKRNLPLEFPESTIMPLHLERMDAIRDGIERLAKLRIETDEWIGGFHYFQLFDSEDFSEGNEPIFEMAAECRQCEDKRCRNVRPSKDFHVWQCARHLCCCSYKYRSYFGIDILKVRDGDAGISIVTLRKIVSESIDRGLMIGSIKRLLHDAGQYVSGILNLVSMNSHIVSGHSVTVSVDDIKSIVSMTEALGVLLESMHQILLGKVKSGRAVYQLHQIFHKYMRCFSKAKVDIRLISQNPVDGFYEKVIIPRGFEVVVLNLICNAIKYLPFDSRYRTVDILFYKNDLGIQVVVKSLGPPVPEDEIPLLGTEGFRSALAKRMNVKGQGLGLNAVVQYAKSAGIEVLFDSASPTVVCGEDEFRTFSVKLSFPRQCVETS